MMQTAKKEYLNFCNYTDLRFWDYYTLSPQNKISANFPLVQLSKVIQQRKRYITISDNQEYSRCRVQINGKGVVLRDTTLGKHIKTKKQQVCKTDDFLVAEIDAKVGGYGIVPPNLEGAIVSSHYFLFQIDTSLLRPDFLAIVVQQQQFAKQVKSTGSTNYSAIRPHHVLEYKIPLPTLEQQEKFVVDYNEKLEIADKLTTQSSDIENEIETFINEELGIRCDNHKPARSRFYFVEFKYLNRWDEWINSKVQKESLYPIILLSDIAIGKPKYGANVKGVKVDSNTRYIRITDINDAGTLNDEFVSPEKVDEQFLLKDNDFLIARSGNTVGKTFLYKSHMGKAMYAGYLIKFNFDVKKIIPEYMLVYTKSKFYKDWIRANQRISGQPNINGQEFLTSPVVLPPLDVQNKIIRNVQQYRISKIKKIGLAIKMRNQAQQEFEQALFID